MKFIADLHIHSYFSRATAKNLNLENIHMAAQLKGITVVGTGDFTHPGWFSEIKEKLIPAEEGLFKLRDDIAKHCEKKVPRSCRGPVRFILVSEISNIYKKDNRTRKNHNLVFAPDFEVAENFNKRLDKIGNLKSDGRPILGLDARKLLEIMIEISGRAFLIPAHIWTPWFSLLGSKSGFDSIEECFGDLSSHIFAVETGLSSDPAMNWRISALDGLTLVSNSDAHSPLKLGREANIFNTELSYDSIKSALKTGNPEKFLGTLEFYPEEGKYHLDGHRKCNVRFRPEKTRLQDGKCPVCERPLTLGVLYRVEELADRPEGVKPEKYHPYQNIVPLTEILSEIFKVGSGSKKIMNKYSELLEKLGPEIKILSALKTETLETAGIPLLPEAIMRMRNNEIIILPGYDGEFGTIKIFNPQEREKLLGQKKLFILPVIDVDPPKKTKIEKKACLKPAADKWQTENTTVISEKQITFSHQQATHKTEKPIYPYQNLNPEQKRAVEYTGGPLIIVAGPGTGKTHTLTCRIAYLITAKGISPQNILAVTFTNKAAQEMRHRLRQIIGNLSPLPFVNTFHGLCFKLLNDYQKKSCTVIDDSDRKILISDAIKHVYQKHINVSEIYQKHFDWIISAKQQILGFHKVADDFSDSEKQIFAAVYQSYQNLLSIQNLCDYEDLVMKTVLLFEKEGTFIQKYRDLYKFVFVDEYQDLNQGQYRIIQALAPPGVKRQNICVIGDPDQSIYGFRGSNIKYFKYFKKDYPDAEIIYLTRNYRSTQTILDASYQVIRNQNKDASGSRIFSQIGGARTINIFETASEKAEAVAVGKAIEQLIGGTGFHSIDFGNIRDNGPSFNRSFSDFAILYRTAGQGRIFSDVFDTAGIPYQIVNRETIFNAKGISELISLLKILEGSGCYMDLERIRKLTVPGISRQLVQILKHWGYQNRFTLASALKNARRFPIEDMTTARQAKVNDFLNILENIERQIKGLSTEKKLLFLTENTWLSEIIPKDPEAEKAYSLLIDISRTFQENIADFFATAALQTDTDIYEPRSEKVVLMTMHAAKGLEFPIVFVVGCESGYLPFQKTEDHKPDIDEERRLFYVAMTRAKEQLYLTYANRRRIYGNTQKRNISVFVDEIEKRLITHAASLPVKPKKERQAQLKLF